MSQKNNSEILKEINRHIKRIESRGVSWIQGVDECNELIKVLGGDIEFRYDANVGTVMYYLVLLAMKKIIGYEPKMSQN